MPKVIHVLRKFEPGEWGGIETHLVGLIPALARLGWTSEVHAPREAGTDGAPLTALGAAFKTFRARYPYLRMTPEKRAGLVAAGGNLVSVEEMVSLLFAREASVLHVHTLGRLGGVVRTAARLKKIPYAVTLHGPVRANTQVIEKDAVTRTSGLRDVGAPFGWLVGARHVARDADLLFALNRPEHDAWASDRARAGRHLELVAHGVDPTPATDEARREARALVPGLGSAPYAVVVARIDRMKGQNVAIEAFRRVAPEGLHLVLAGSTIDRAYAAELANLAAEAGPRVHLAGGVTPKIARALFAEAKLALLPSRAEPFGIALLEAWAEGTPALFADVDGLRDIAARTGATYGSVTDNSVEGWARRLAEVLRDSEGLSGDKAAARARVRQHYSWDTLAERTAKAYETRARVAR